MPYQHPDPDPDERVLKHRRSAADHTPEAVAGTLPPAEPQAEPTPEWRTPRRMGQAALLLVVLLAVLGSVAWLAARHWVRSATLAALPQIDGSLHLGGLSAPVSVVRDSHGVPHIHASTLDDLLVAQGFVTAQDRLFQMDTLRRHAAGELAEILGPNLLQHDRLQRTLQIRAAADRTLAQLPADQVHMLEQYSRGVNAAIEIERPHLPLEFRILGYQPAPWTPRDSLLVSLAMFEDLTDTFPAKLAREHLSARLPAALVQDLYPVGSWRDHPPTTPEPDLTLPGPPIEEVPLDESQAANRPPSFPRRLGAPSIAPFAMGGLVADPQCPACTAGSNNWVVSGAHTASGKPLLANDMHLTLSLPGIWYESDLESTSTEPGAALHVAGVTIPGLPLIVVGHNDHLAWGFTNLGADVQDVYIETLRGSGAEQEFRAVDGSWQPVIQISEPIKVKHGRDLPFEVLATRHGDTVTPILTPVLPPTSKDQTRPLALRWTLYDPSVLQLPMLEIAQSHDWPSFLAAFAKFGGPAQNVVYADDAGHIGYHAVGRIPLRGPAVAAAPALPADLASPSTPPETEESTPLAANPDPIASTDIQAPAAAATSLRSGPLSPVPLVPGPAHEWSGYIPFDQLPQVFDPPGGVIATANARIVQDDYPYPIALNWAAPYRNERLWRVLAGTTHLRPEDMLAIQTDVYSDFDHVLGQRLAYAIDHTPGHSARLSAAADLLRTWNGRMTADSPAAAIASAVHGVLWPMLLAPKLSGGTKTSGAPSIAPHALGGLPTTQTTDLNALYSWGERDYALEQILAHTPPRWLPPGYASYDQFLAAAVTRALAEARAPADLSQWRYGSAHTVDLESPIYEQSQALRLLLGHPTGTGAQPQSGDGTTIKQVGRSFGPSERLTVDLANLDRTTLNLVLGQSGNPASPWYLDQFPAWLHGATFAFPYTDRAVTQASAHTLTLTP